MKYVARDAQLDVIVEGETIGLYNAHAKVLNGFMRLEVDKWSIVKPAEDSYKIEGEVDLENNQSDVEYELVPTTYGQPKVNVSKAELEAQKKREEEEEKAKQRERNNRSRGGRGGGRGRDRGDGDEDQ